MSKIGLLITLLQVVGPAVKDNWETIRAVLDLVKKAPRQARRGPPLQSGREEKVNEAEKQECLRLASECGVEEEASEFCNSL